MQRGRAAPVGLGGVVRPPSALPSLSQASHRHRLYRAWRVACARQRLWHLGRDLLLLTSRAVMALGARLPRWGGAAVSERAVPQSRRRGAAAAASVAPGGV